MLNLSSLIDLTKKITRSIIIFKKMKNELKLPDNLFDYLLGIKFINMTNHFEELERKFRKFHK